MIKTFSYYYDFLANDYKSTFTFNGREWDTVEQAYQACKTGKVDDITRLGAYDAHVYGNTAERLPEFSTSKYTVLLHILAAKFSNEELKNKLLRTGNEFIVFNSVRPTDAHWGKYIFDFSDDNPWSNNYLGKLLMWLRHALKYTGDVGSVSTAFLDTFVPFTVSKEDVQRYIEWQRMFRSNSINREGILR